MPAVQELIRLIRIVARSEGVAAAKGELDNLAKSHGAVARATETTTKSTISLEKRLESLQRTLDAEYRAEQNLAKVQRDLDAAVRQGIVGQERANALSVMAAQKYRTQGEAAVRAAEGVKVLREMMTGFVGGMIGGAFTVGLAELPMAVNESIEKLGNIGNVADTIGITTDALQELRYAARLSDVEVGTLDDALAKFSVNLGNANSPLNKLLQLNHVKVSGDLLTDLERFADLVKSASNQEERNVIVTTAFGKSAQEMGRLFDEGSAGIERWARSALASGGVIDPATVEKAREMNDAMENLKPRIEAAQAELAVLVGPTLIATLQAFNDTLRTTLDLFRAFPDKSTISLERELSDLQSTGQVTTGPFGAVPHGNIFAMGADSGPGAQSTRNARIAELQTELRRRATLNLRDDLLTGSAGDASLLYAGIIPGSGSKPSTKLPPVIDTAAKQRQEGIDRVTDSLKLQLRALSETDRQAYIDQELSQAKVTAATKEGRAIEALAGKYYDQKKAIEDYSGVAISFTQTLLGDLKQGKSLWEGFADAAVSSLEQIAQKMLATNITNAIAGIVTGGFGGFGGGATGGSFGNGLWGSAIFSAIHHTGGVAGYGGAGMMVPAAAFAGAPRYHSGGIAGLKPDEVPAILQRGERVLPRGESAGGVSLHVVVQGNADSAAIEQMKREIVPLLERHNRHKARRRV